MNLHIVVNSSEPHEHWAFQPLSLDTLTQGRPSCCCPGVCPIANWIFRLEGKCKVVLVVVW